MSWPVDPAPKQTIPSSQRTGSKFLREVVPGTPPPWVPGTPDNVKRAIMLDMEAYNRSVDINEEYQTPTSSTLKPPEVQPQTTE